MSYYTVGFVACCSQKLPHAAAAHQLYCSDLFKKAYAWAKYTCDEVWILSARHTLLHPSIWVDPYDQTLNNMTKTARNVWAIDVMRRWDDYIRPKIRLQPRQEIEIVMLAGAMYREFLCNMFAHRLIPVRCPLKGLGIGEQKQWFAKRKHEVNA